MDNWLANILAIIGMTGISGHWYYLNILDTNKNHIKKNIITIERENIKINIQKKPIKKIQKIETKKKVKVISVKKLLKSGLLYNGYIKGDDGRYIAMAKKNNKSIILRVGEKYAGVMVNSISKTTIQITGFETIYINGYKKSKKEEKEVVRKENDNIVKEKSETIAKENDDIVKEKNVEKISQNVIKTRTPYESITIQNQEHTQDQNTSMNVDGEKRILRSLIREIKEEPNSIYKYVSLYNSSKGVKVIPKENYTHIFFGIGLRIGDIIKEINGHSVKSPSILLQAINVANKTNIKLLLENNGQTRTITVNLMKVFKI